MAKRENLTVKEIKPGDVLEIQRKKVLFHTSYGFCGEGEPIALIGSHRYLEIAINKGNAAILFNKKQGEEVIIKTKINIHPVIEH